MIDSYLAPALVGEDASRAAHLLARMDRAVAGNHFAKAPLEVACYDLLGKALGVPVHDLLGGLYRDSLPSVWALASGDPRTDVAEAEEKIEANLHSRFKLKAGAEEPAADVERIVKISKALGEEAGLVVDPNGAWDELTARLLMPRPEEAGVALLEQPVPRWNLEGMARLTAMRSVPIMADESVCSAQDALAVVRDHCADVIAIKLPKSGGITGARKIAAVAEAAGVPLYGGSTLETSVGTAASLHVYCSVPRMTEGCELFGPLWLADDIVEEPVEFRDCRVWLPREPGIGVRLDEEKVAHYRKAEQ
jgi:muconate cycloisomerase